MIWSKRETWRQWAQLSEGCYLLRTNLTDWNAEDLWKAYIQLTQAESAFRVQKSEFNLRPIWHQEKDTVQAHILFSFLAYAMWKTLEQWMSHSGLGNGPRPLIEELARIKSSDVILPTSTGREIRIRCVTTPDESQRTLLGRLGLQQVLAVRQILESEVALLVGQGPLRPAAEARAAAVRQAPRSGRNFDMGDGRAVLVEDPAGNWQKHGLVLAGLLGRRVRRRRRLFAARNWGPPGFLRGL